MRCRCAAASLPNFNAGSVQPQETAIGVTDVCSESEEIRPTSLAAEIGGELA